MKVILYAAITANGFIAKPDDNTDFVSSEEWDSYKQMVKKAGCIICGRRTYEEGLKSGTLLTQEGFHIVLTINPKLTSSDPRVMITTESPNEALKILEEKGFSEVIIGGGGKLNASFLQSGLVDEIYLDIEPHLFSAGIPVTYPFKSDLELELLETKPLSPQTIQLHYRVQK